jgi:hypothetical protein
MEDTRQKITSGQALYARVTQTLFRERMIYYFNYLIITSNLYIIRMHITTQV